MKRLLLAFAVCALWNIGCQDNDPLPGEPRRMDSGLQMPDRDAARDSQITDSQVDEDAGDTDASGPDAS